MHEDNFLSRWLREDVEDKTEEIEKAIREATEEVCQSVKSEFEGEKRKGGCGL